MKYLEKSLLIPLLILLLCTTGIFKVNAQAFKVDTIVYNGDPARFVNIVFMGDGFQPSEVTNYLTNVKNLTDYFFSVSPFFQYRNYFNVFAVRVPSTQSGANHPGNATDELSSNGQPVLTVSNYFNSTFDYFSIHRLLVPQNSTAINNVLLNSFPLYDQTFMLINSTFYGGSGGANIAASSLNSSSYEVLVHEVGHSFAGLSDEYYAGDFYAFENTNMTMQSNPALVKWKDWIGVNGVGVYKHCCGGNSEFWYKPHQNCKMQTLGQRFCPVCEEKIIETIHDIVPALRSFTPSDQNTISYCANPLTFKLALNKPIPNTIKVKWVLNGNTVPVNLDSIMIDGGQLALGNNNLSAIVIDTTIMVRAAAHSVNHADTIKWTISSSVVAPVVTAGGPLVFCEGGSVTLSSSPGTSYAWSNGATTQSIIVNTSGLYTVVRKDLNGCTATSLPVNVVVNTMPAIPATITGNNTVCAGSNQDYSVAAVPGVTSYTWTVPAGWTGNAVTNSISAKAGTAGGVISVVAKNSCGSSTAKTMDVSISPVPVAPDLITGAVLANTAQILDYSIAAVSGATGYAWSVDAGGTIVAGQNTQTVSVKWATAGIHNLTVMATNSCGNGAGKNLAIDVSIATAIIDPDDQFHLRILPNPSTGEFFLQVKDALNKEIKIKVVNIAGQKIYGENLRVRSNDFTQRIDLRNSANGIYQVIISINKKMYLRKLLKSQ